MTSQTLPEFAPDRSADEVDASLRQSLAVADEARRCAVLWFAEVQRRELWRAFGHASLELYAVHRLGFSRNRFWQFKRLADDLDRLPTLREAVADGRIGWTKAQQVARVATVGTAAGWVDCAVRSGRRELAMAVTAEVARVRGAAQRVVTATNRAQVASAAGTSGSSGSEGQLALGLGTPPIDVDAVAAAACGEPDSRTARPDRELAIPATVALRADALQVARFEALVAQARKQGRVPAQAGRMELVLAALERLVASGGDGAAEAKRSQAPTQVIVHRCPDCAATTVTTAGGERTLAPAQVAALTCDAQVVEPGKPNRAVVPPRVRRTVLARDRHRCTSPGCGVTAFLEVHHVVPRNRGGANDAANLVTLCGRCHAFAHAGGVAPAQLRARVPSAAP